MNSFALRLKEIYCPDGGIGRRAGLKHLWETVPVRLRLRVLNRKTPDKALFIRGFWFDKDY